MQPNTPPTEDSSAEPESYTLEEMMEKLKERGQGEGELVTRADGTQAIKVKKRKRRSTQPHKEKAKMQQKIRIFQFGIVFFLLAALVATAAGMLFYYNSSSFRESVRVKVAAWTAADVEFSEFSVTPKKARCAAIKMNWPEGNHLRSLTLGAPIAHLDVTSFLGAKWGGSSVVASSGNLDFAPAIEGKEKRGAIALDNAEFPFNFAAYRCEKLDILGYGKDKQAWMSIEATDAAMIKNTRGAQLRLVGGLVKILGFEPVKLDRATMFFELGQMKIDTMRFKPKDGGAGTLEFGNAIDLYSKESSKLKMTLVDFPIEVLLGDGLGKVINGLIGTDNDSLNRVLTLTPGEYNTFSIQLGFRGSDRDALSIKNFPFLSDLSRELQDRDFNNSYVFSDRMEGELLRSADQATIKGLHLEKEGSFVVKGEISFRAGKLEGELQLGLSPSQLGSAAPEMRKVFSKVSENYQWCTIQVSGTPDLPMDNFADLLKQAMLAAPTASPDTSLTPRSIEDELDGE